MVARNSMQTRYFIEMVFFFLLVLAFQYWVLDFIRKWNHYLDFNASINKFWLDNIEVIFRND